MKKLVFLFLMCGLGLCARANDTSGYVLPTGGVVFEKQDGIQMKTEALYIRPGQIEVNYLFENTTDKDITAQIFFPLPDMTLVTVYPQPEPYHHYHFQLWVNGKPAAYRTNLSIKYKEQDKTKEVAWILHSPEEYLSEEDVDRRLLELPENTRLELQKKGVLTKGWIIGDDGERPAWLLSGQEHLTRDISYSWEQTFPAGKTVHVRHTYVPTAMTTNVGTPFSRCLNKDSDEYQEFMTELPAGDTQFLYNDHLYAQLYVEYILTTANNWQGPIQSFNLLVESPLKSVGCFDGEEFYGGNYFAVNRSNYTPQWDLSVDFVANHDIDATKYRPKSAPELFRVDGPANVREKPRGKVIGQMENDTYVWSWPGEKQGKWYRVAQNDLRGYTYAQNLIKVF